MITEQDLLEQEIEYLEKVDVNKTNTYKNVYSKNKNITLLELQKETMDKEEEKVVSSPPCPSCKSEYAIVRNLQLRAGDEASKLEYRCQCGTCFKP